MVTNRDHLFIDFYSLCHLDKARFIEVTEGVEIDEQVITIGNHTLEDNSPITLEVEIPKKESEDSKDESEKSEEKLETTE